MKSFPKNVIFFSSFLQQLKIFQLYSNCQKCKKTISNQELQNYTQLIAETHLSVPNLMLHLSRFLRRPAKQQNSAGEPVESVDGPQILQVVFLGQYENDRIVSVATTGMYLHNHKNDVTFSRKKALHEKKIPLSHFHPK